MERLPKPSWPAIGAYVAGCALILAWLTVARGEWLALLLGCFLIALGLFAPRIEELAFGRDGFKAKLFREVVELITEKVEPDESSPSGTTTPSEPGSPAAPAEEGNLDDGDAKPRLSTEVGPDITWRNAGGQAQALIELKNVGQRTSTEEFTNQLLRYLWEARSPGFRHLSESRRDAEERLFRAVLDLRSEPLERRDSRLDPPVYNAIEDGILRWWNTPQALSDADVADLADRIEHVLGRGQGP